MTCNYSCNRNNKKQMKIMKIIKVNAMTKSEPLKTKLLIIIN